MTQVAELLEASSTEAPDSPYVGLTPFTEADAPFFFGREKERRIIAANLMASRLTLLYGVSGVGKSSILRAGLQRDFRDRARARLAEGRLLESVVVVFSAWRDDPIAGLAECIESSVADLLGDDAPDPPPRGLHLDELLAEWNERLDERAASLADPGSLESGERPRTELLVVFDQFEQYFLYHADEDGEGTFAFEFPRAVNREDLRANFLIALREDAYAQLDRFEGRILNLFGSNLRIEHLDRPAAKAAIEKPIDKYNELLGLGDDDGFSIEPELVEAVLDSVKAGSIVLGQAGSGVVQAESTETRIETPFLQLVMSRLWDEEREQKSRTLRRETLRSLGGAEQIVRAHLEDAMRSLQPEERVVAARVFHQLVTPSGAKIAHSSRDLADYAETSEAELLPILEKLDAERILHSVDPAPGDTAQRFEIRHDVLAGAVVEWSSRYEEERRRAELTAAEQRKLDEERQRQRARLVFRFGVVISVLFLLAVAFGIVASVYYVRAQTRANVSRSDVLAQTVFASIRSGGDPVGNVMLASHALLHVHATPAAEQAFRTAVIQPHIELTNDTGAIVNAVAVSPDGKSIVTADGAGGARVWSAATGRLVRVLGAAGAGHATLDAAFSSRGNLIVTANSDGTTRIWNPVSGQPVSTFGGGSGAVEAVAFSSDGTLVAAAGDDGKVRIWNLGAPGGKPVDVLGGGRRLLTVALSPRANVVAAAGDDGRVRLWNLQRPNADPVVLPGNGQPVLRVVFAPKGDRLLVGRVDGTASLWDVGHRRLVRAIQVGTGGVHGVNFSADGRFLVTAGDDGTARIWDAGTGDLVTSLVPASVVSPPALEDAAFTPDGREIVTGGAGLSVWDAGMAQSPRATVLARSAQTSSSAGFSPDGKLVVTASAPGTARIWRVGGGAAPTVLGGFTGLVDSAAFSANGGFVVTAGYDGAARVWNASTGRLAATLGGGGVAVTNAALDPDGKLVVTTTGNGRVRIWPVAGGTHPRSYSLPGNAEVVTAAFSPDGAQVLTARNDGSAAIWRSSDGRPLVTLARPGSSSLTGAAFSPDGKRVVTVVGGHALVWDPEGAKKLEETLALSGPTMTVAAFSPDSTLLATGDRSGSVVIWNLARRQIVAVLPAAGDEQAIQSVAFSRDGKFVVAASADGTARVWTSSAGGSPLAVLRTDAGPVLGATFSSDDRYVLTTSADGTRLYPCEACFPVHDLIATLQRTGSWTKEELSGG